ncbi:response regulator [Brachybacterium avium]|uniref:Response regulator n=1 Tax=Brachybacterium avium TaxID=2017485 RepID=A0A220UCB3_9MICO|nr:response regulator transcription factor [Brachybacterium avium]ASK65333.1 response regulator [Brachybacterium avium]
MAHILFVDDDADLVELVSLRLRSCGHEVTAVGSVDAARNALAAHSDVDLVVVDRTMPGRSGADLLRGLRAEGSTPQVLMLTARDREHGPEDGRTPGAEDCMTEPFTPDELATRIISLLAC